MDVKTTKPIGYANACVVWCPKCTPKRLIAKDEFLPVDDDMAGEECDRCGATLGEDDSDE